MSLIEPVSNLLLSTELHSTIGVAALVSSGTRRRCINLCLLAASQQQSVDMPS